MSTHARINTYTLRGLTSSRRSSVPSSPHFILGTELELLLETNQPQKQSVNYYCCYQFKPMQDTHRGWANVHVRYRFIKTRNFAISLRELIGAHMQLIQLSMHWQYIDCSRPFLLLPTSGHRESREIWTPEHASGDRGKVGWGDNEGVGKE